MGYYNSAVLHALVALLLVASFEPFLAQPTAVLAAPQKLNTRTPNPAAIMVNPVSPPKPTKPSKPYTISLDATKKYFIDDSCIQREKDFGKIVREMFDIAGRADRRLARPDSDWRLLFRVLMGFEMYEDTTYIPLPPKYKMLYGGNKPNFARDHLRRTLGGIANGWVESPREESEVRIYCDNMKRMRKFGTFEMWDALNQMAGDQRMACAPPGVTVKAASAWTILLHLTKDQLKQLPKGTEEDPIPQRATIDICDIGFDTHRMFKDFEYDPAKPAGYKDLEKERGLSALMPITHTLLHEFAHTWRYLLGDQHYSDPLYSMGWSNVRYPPKYPVPADPKKSMENKKMVTDNAEIIAMLGSFAWAMDHRPRNPKTGKPADRGGYAFNRLGPQGMDQKDYRAGRVLKAYDDVVPL